MDCNFNQPRTISEARRQANSYTKALTMTGEGYRFLQYAKTPVYAIFKPENKATTTGRGDYNVNLTPGKKACDCPDFQKNGVFCKHTLWLDAELKKLEQAEEEALMEHLCNEYDLRAKYEW